MKLKHLIKAALLSVLFFPQTALLAGLESSITASNGHVSPAPTPNSVSDPNNNGQPPTTSPSTTWNGFTENLLSLGLDEQFTTPTFAEGEMAPTILIDQATVEKNIEKHGLRVVEIIKAGQ